MGIFRLLQEAVAREDSTVTLFHGLSVFLANLSLKELLITGSACYIDH